MHPRVLGSVRQYSSKCLIYYIFFSKITIELYMNLQRCSNHSHSINIWKTFRCVLKMKVGYSFYKWRIFWGGIVPPRIIFFIINHYSTVYWFRYIVKFKIISTRSLTEKNISLDSYSILVFWFIIILDLNSNKISSGWEIVSSAKKRKYYYV